MGQMGLMGRMMAGLAACLLAGCYSEHPSSEKYAPTVFAAEHQAKAAGLLRASKFEEALPEAELAVKDDPGFAAAAMTRAVILLRLQRLEEAKMALASLCRQWPDLADGQALHGVVLEKLGDEAGAREAYQAAVTAFDRSLPPGGKDPRMQLARAVSVYLRDGRSEGLMQLNQVQAAYPNYAPANDVKQLVLDNNRSFVIDWMTRQAN